MNHLQQTNKQTNKQTLFLTLFLFLIFNACSSEQENNADMNVQAETRSGIPPECGCIVQLLDINDPCCYRIKCDEQRYATIGIDGCTNGGDYNYYIIPGTGGAPGGWVEICSPSGGKVKLYLHSADGKCSCGLSFCQLYGDAIYGPGQPCNNAEHVCDLPPCN